MFVFTYLKKKLYMPIWFFFQGLQSVFLCFQFLKLTFNSIFTVPQSFFSDLVYDLSSSFIFFFLFISYFSFFKLVRCFFSRVSFLYLFNFMFVLFFFMVCTAMIFFSIPHFCYLTTLMFCYSHIIIYFQLYCSMT